MIVAMLAADEDKPDDLDDASRDRLPGAQLQAAQS